MSSKNEDNRQMEVNLERPCSDDHLAMIAKELARWEEVALVLGLTDAVVEEIDGRYHTLPIKRTKMLLKWKNRSKEHATYQRLITCFDVLEREDMAERVRQIAAMPSCEGVVHSSEFADELKDWYTYTDPDPDVWPPIEREKFFKPAIVRTEAGSSYNTDKGMKSSTRDRNIHRTVPIELNNIFDNSKETKRKQVILIEGAPGAGKSRLLWYMCQKWASGEMFQEFRLVIYIRLRDYNTTQPLCNIADILPCSNDIKEAAWNEIKADSGKGVLFLLDGWDELPQSLQKNSIYKDILKSLPQHSLLRSTAVVTSRYISSDDLYRLAVSHLEVLGFGDQEVKDCILDIMGNEEAAHQLMECLESRPSLLSCCHIPLNIMIITYVFQVKRHTLPSTMLETFKLLILNCIERHIKNSEPEVEHEEITSLENLPQKVKTSFDCLCELAFNGLKEDRAVFMSNEFHSIPNHLSLLHGTKVYKETGPTMLYSFLHQTTQELLAARHLSRMLLDDQFDYLRNLISQPRLHGMIQFYAGITSFQLDRIGRIVCDILAILVKEGTNNLTFTGISQKSSMMKKVLLSAPCIDYEILVALFDREDNAIKKKLRSDESELNRILETVPEENIKISIRSLLQDPESDRVGQLTLLVANSFYEANNPALFRLIPGYPVMIANIPLLPSDCLSLGSLIAQAGTKCIFFSECKMTSKCIDMFMQGLGKSSSIEDIRFSSFEEDLVMVFCKELVANIKVKDLWLCCCTVSSDNFTIILRSLKNCPLRSFHFFLSDVEINDSNGRMLQEFIETMPLLRSLDLTQNEIGNIGAYYIGEALKSNSTLESLNLKYCGITTFGALALSDGLEVNKSLKELTLSDNCLGDEGIFAISRSLALNSTISVLKIDYCGFGLAGISFLAGALICNTTISQIVWTPDYDMNIEAIKEKVISTGLLTPSAVAILFPEYTDTSTPT